MNQYFENNMKLKSNLIKTNVKIKNTEFSLYKDNGIFNKKGLDYGTKLLLENINLENKETFLDMGCGAGPVGIYLLKNNPQYKVDMVDVNERALHLSKMSIEKNKLQANIFKSNAYENINKKYDAIITNPPIHAGKKKVYEIIENAKSYLTEKGELWIVMRKDQGALSMINDFKNVYEFRIIKKSKGFFVIKGI